MKTKHYTLTPEGEATAPTGFLTDRSPQTNLGGGLSNGQVEKQYPGTEHDNLLIADNGIQSQGGQAINPKPDEETATIGDDNLGAGTSVLEPTYPYPPTPNLDHMGTSEEVIMPKLQVSGPPQDSYGVRNTMSNSSNFGAVADNQLNAVVERVEAAIMAEITAPKDPMTLEGASTLPIKQDGNEVVTPDGTMMVPNGMAGTDAKTQIPRQTKTEEWKAEKIADDYHFPYIIAFDYNGTIDARNTGRGIPIQVLQDLQRRGKKVLVFTSSTQGADKEFMRQTLDKIGIPYTDDERVLIDVDMLIGDKKSDEKRAGRYGVKFIDVNDFSMDKVLAKSVSIPGMNRTAIGDSWDGNVNDYRENGAPIIMNTITQRDILTQLLRARGFVDNEMNPISQGQIGGRLRLEHKLGGAICTVEGSQDNQRLKVSITDRTGAPELVTDDWSKLYGYLGEKFPREE